MQFTITIDQVRAQLWNLSPAEAIVFAYIHSCTGWSEPVRAEDGKSYRWVSRSTLIAQVPMAAKSMRTATRLLGALRDGGLIETVIDDRKFCVRVTEKGMRWLTDKEELEQPLPEPIPSPQLATQKARPSPQLATPLWPQLATPLWPLLATNELNKNINKQVIKNMSLVSDESVGDVIAQADLELPEVTAPDTTPKAISVTDLPKTGSRVIYPDWFEDLWKLYPAREGGSPKRKSYTAYVARLRDGVEHCQLVDGVTRYAEYAEKAGIVGTQFVQQLSTFLGPDEHWAREWVVTGKQRASVKRLAPTTIVEMEGRDYSHPDGAILSIEDAFRPYIDKPNRS